MSYCKTLSDVVDVCLSEFPGIKSSVITTIVNRLHKKDPSRLPRISRVMSEYELVTYQIRKIKGNANMRPNRIKSWRRNRRGLKFSDSLARNI